MSPELALVWKKDDLKRRPRPRMGSTEAWARFAVGGKEVVLKDAPIPQPARSFPMPEGYRLPQKGAAGKAALRVWSAIKAGRSVYLYGEAGTGKSALIRALCALSRKEASHYAMRESLDPESYLGRTVIRNEGGASVTSFQKGPLLLDLEGRVGLDGIRRPVVILLDDMDRAPAEYVEILRHVLEDNARNVFVPELGTAIDVFPGTVIVATANSAGRGDSSALYASVQVLDDSVLDRFQAFVKAHWLSREEELLALKEMHTVFQEDELNRVLDVAEGLREAARRGDVQGNFSMRRLKLWLHAATELWEDPDNQYANRNIALLHGAEDWLDRLEDETELLLATDVLKAALGDAATPSRRGGKP